MAKKTQNLINVGGEGFLSFFDQEIIQDKERKMTENDKFNQNRRQTPLICHSPIIAGCDTRLLQRVVSQGEETIFTVK